MSNLIYRVYLNRIRAHTVFKASLSIYEDFLVFKKRKWFNVSEVTITFNHIAQANIIKGLFFSTLEIVSSGGYENASLNHVLNKYAKKAKKIIDQKIYRMGTTGGNKKQFEHHEDHQIDKFEKSLGRLKELLNRGKISKKEYETKRKKLLKTIS
jgi:hypothetical protein